MVIPSAIRLRNIWAYLTFVRLISKYFTTIVTYWSCFQEYFEISSFQLHCPLKVPYTFCLPHQIYLQCHSATYLLYIHITTYTAVKEMLWPSYHFNHWNIPNFSESSFCWLINVSINHCLAVQQSDDFCLSND